MFVLYKNCWVNNDPPHQRSQMEPSQLQLYLKRGGYFVRNNFNFDNSRETPFWYVIKDHFGGMEELSSKVRNQVKKSLKTYDIEKITPEEFSRIALPIYNSAQESYKIKASLSTQSDIDNLANNAEKKGFEFWAVFTKEAHKPVAVSVNTITRDDTKWHGCCEYNTMKCDPLYQHNSSYPYYGLIYEMNRYYLEECKLGYVNDGARSMTSHSNIQGFLIDKFKFRKAYCDFQIIYKPWFGTVVKILYPFRRFIKHPKVAAILRQEAWARGIDV